MKVQIKCSTTLLLSFSSKIYIYEREGERERMKEVEIWFQREGERKEGNTEGREIVLEGEKQGGRQGEIKLKKKD